MHPAVGIPVGYKQVAVGGQGDVGAAVERPSGLPHRAVRARAARVRGGIPYAHRHQRFAVQRTFYDRVGLAHRQIHVVLTADEDAVGVGQIFPTPLVQEVALPVEYHERVVSAVEHVHPIL